MDKNKLVVILAGLTLVLFIFNIGSCVSAYNQNSSRKKEMFQRLDLEEKMARSTQENAAKLNALEKQLDEEKASSEAVKKSLAQEQMINSSLKEDLQKITKAKDALEEEFKKATLTTKKAKK